MDLKHALRNGMQVVGIDDRPYGTVERYDDAAVYVQGRRVPLAAIERTEHDRLYLDTPDLWGLTRSDVAGTGLGSGARAAGPDGTGPAASRDGEDQDASRGIRSRSVRKHAAGLEPCLPGLACTGARLHSRPCRTASQGQGRDGDGTGQGGAR